MSIAFRALAAATSEGRSGQQTFTVVLPSEAAAAGGFKAGELLVVLFQNNVGTAPQTPAGVESVRATAGSQGNLGQHVFTRTLTDDDRGASLAFTNPNGVRGGALAVIVSGSTGTLTLGASVQPAGSTTPNGGAATCTAADQVILQFLSARVGASPYTTSIDAPGATELTEAGSTFATGPNIYGHISWRTAGAVGTIAGQEYQSSASVLTIGTAAVLTPAAAPTPQSQTERPKMWLMTGEGHGIPIEPRYVSDGVGPVPALFYMAESPVDTTDQTKPTTSALSLAGATSATSQGLTWTASTDASGIREYRLYNGTAKVAEGLTGTSTVLTGLSPSTAYSLTIEALDNAEPPNVSERSAAVPFTTAAAAGDQVDPSAPASLTPGTPTTSSVALSWPASTDNVGVVGYLVFADGSQLPGTVTGTSTTVTGRTAGSTVDFTVKAIDAAGNVSDPSPVARVVFVSTGIGSEFTSGPTGLAGGGYQNGMERSPFLDTRGGGSKRWIIMPGDVAGLSRSDDDGQSWDPRNRVVSASGAISAHHVNVGSARWHPLRPGVGFSLANDGIRRTTNFFDFTQFRAGGASADGNGEYHVGGPAGQIQGGLPRITGKLIEFHPTNPEVMYVASYSPPRVVGGNITGHLGPHGLARSNDDYATVDRWAMVDDNITGLATDPNDPDVVYVAVWNGGQHGRSNFDLYGDRTRNGVWKISNATTTMDASKLGDWPATLDSRGVIFGAHELAVDDNNGVTTVIAACGAAGVYYIRPEGAGTSRAWTAWNNGLDGTKMQTVEIARTSAGVTVLAGGANPEGTCVLWRATSIGGAWTGISKSALTVLHDEDFGTDHRSLIAEIAYHNHGGPSSSCTGIVILSPTDIVFSGRGGARRVQFKTADSKWHSWPSNSGLQVTVNMHVAPHPTIAGRYLVGSMDYTQWFTTDGGVTFKQIIKGAPTTGNSAAWDSWPIAGQPVAAVAVAAERPNPGSAERAGLFYSENPGTDPFTLEPYPGTIAGISHVNSAGVREFYDTWGSVLMRTGAGGDRVVMGSVYGGGVIRKVGLTGTYSRLTDSGIHDAPGNPPYTSGNPGPRQEANFAPVPMSPVVYLHANGGLHRSNEAGAPGTWTKILDLPGPIYGNARTLAVDPVDKTVLYVSKADGGLVKLTNPRTSTGPSSTEQVALIASGTVGPISCNPRGVLYASMRSGQLYRWLNPRRNPSDKEMRADQYWLDNTKDIRDLQCDAGGALLTADNGQGHIKGIDPGGMT